MKRYFKTAVFCVSLAVPLLQVSVLRAQQPDVAPPAPPPAQFRTAKRVFVGNRGADAPWVGRPNGQAGGPFSGGPDRPYNQFYAALKAWGRYELVGTPGDADLVFEIQFGIGPVYPEFRLVVRDPKTHSALWAVTEHLPAAARQESRDKNFDQAIARLVSDIQALTAPATTGNPTGQ